MGLAQGAAATQIPFWLQLTTVIVAPLVGFVGVAVGSFLTSRHNNRSWIRDRRLEAYQALLECANELSLFAGTIAPRALRSQDPDQLYPLAQDIGQKISALIDATQRIKLIGSKATNEAASEVLAAATSLPIVLGLAAKSDIFDRKEWTKAAMMPMVAPLQRFLWTAQRDLGTTTDRRSPHEGKPVDVDRIVDFVDQHLKATRGYTEQQ